jgi:hypothetical protein
MRRGVIDQMLRDVRDRSNGGRHRQARAAPALRQSKGQFYFFAACRRCGHGRRRPGPERTGGPVGPGCRGRRQVREIEDEGRR